MDQIKDIFKQCDVTLKVVIKHIKDGITQYSNSVEEAPTKSDVRKLRDINSSFTEIVSASKECQGIAKLLYSACERYIKSGEDMSQIQEYLKQYDRCKANIFMQIGFLSKALCVVDGFDIQDDIDKYMLKCDKIGELSELLVSSDILDDLQVGNIDLMAELEESGELYGSSKTRKITKQAKSPNSKSPGKSKNKNPLNPPKINKSVIPQDKSDKSDNSFEWPHSQSNTDDEIEDEENEENEENEETKENEENEENEEKDDEIHPMGEELSDDIGFESDGGLEEKDFFSNENIREGGLDEESNVVVTAGGDTYVVGERARYYIREIMLKLKKVESRDEQIHVLGFEDEQSLTKFVDEMDENYVNQLISQYGLDELLLVALDNLKMRVQDQYTQFKDSNPKGNKAVDGRYRKLLDSIETTKTDTMNWNTHLDLDTSLRILTQCTVAIKQKKVIIDRKNDIKAFIQETANELKRHKSPKIRKSPEPWNKKFEISVYDLNPIKYIVSVQKSWAKQLSELEIYLSQVAEYIDSVWTEETISLPELKYRVYLLSKLKKNPYEKQINTLVTKYNVGDYSTFNKLVKDMIAE